MELRALFWGAWGFSPRRGLESAMLSARSRCSIAELGLRCDHGSIEEGHCLLPSRGPPPSYHCTGCDAHISPSEAARHVNDSLVAVAVREEAARCLRRKVGGEQLSDNL